MSNDRHDEDIVLDDHLEDESPRSPRAAIDGKLGALAESLPRVLERIEKLCHHCERREEELKDRVAGTVSSALASLAQQVSALEERVASLVASTTIKSEEKVPITKLLQVREPDPAPTTDEAFAVWGKATVDVPLGANERWPRLLLGENLTQQDALAGDRSKLLEEVLHGNAAAIGLAGRLMLVQSASAEEIPALLKEIGEAFYRWRPKTKDVSDPLEEALVQSLNKRSVAVGLRNSIELVRPGDRYDSTRHLTNDRGVEVTTVRGWAVLRDNGKPLTKASVSLK